MKRFAVACALAALDALGCRGGGDAGSTTDAAPPPEISGPVGTSPPRRPTRRWYMGRTGDRCDVYWVDGEAISPPTQAPCPADLLPGERMRIAGKTCIRESAGDPTRDQPIVCPDPLTNAEKMWLATLLDGGSPR